jgi:hypothetical protein
MTIILFTLSVAFAAFCVWLTVRIVNRRERWARWTLVGLLVGLPVLYVLSFGPACWWIATTIQEVPGGPPIGNNAVYAPRAYWPIGWASIRSPYLKLAFAWYGRLIGRRSAVLAPVKPTGSEGVILWMQPR